MVQKNAKVLISIIVILGVLVIALGFAALIKMSGNRQVVETIKESHKGADALLEVQGYTVSEGEYSGRTVNEIIINIYPAEEYRHIGWSALEEKDGSVIAGYTVVKGGENILHLFYVIDNTLYTLNNPAIRLFGQKIRYNGTDSQILIMDYVNNILDRRNSSEASATYVKQQTFLFTNKELSDNMMQYLTDKDLLYDMITEGKILMLEKGMEIEVLQVNQLGGWSKVREPINGITGYVSLEYLEVKPMKVRVSPDSLSFNYSSEKQIKSKTVEVPTPTPVTKKNNNISPAAGSPYKTVVDFIAAEMKRDNKAIQDLLIDNEFKKEYFEVDYSGDALIAGFNIIDVAIDGNRSTIEVEEELKGYDGKSIKKTAIFKLVNDDKWLIENYELK